MEHENRIDVIENQLHELNLKRKKLLTELKQLKCETTPTRMYGKSLNFSAHTTPSDKNFNFPEFVSLQKKCLSSFLGKQKKQVLNKSNIR